MKGVARRRLGRFGIVHGVASAAAIAILAVSPALVSVVDSRIDDAGLAIAEAVFGGPASAQESPSGYDKCVADAHRRYVLCYYANPWYSRYKCWAAVQLRRAACLIDPRV